MTTFYKDPDAQVDYSINWSNWLAGDTIATSTWDAPPELPIANDTVTGNVATIWLEGGTEGRAYLVTNTIMTGGGRIEDQTLTIIVAQDGPPAEPSKPVTVADFRQYHRQTRGDSAEDHVIERVLERAQAMVERYIGHSYGAWDGLRQRTLAAPRASRWQLPSHTLGSVVEVLHAGQPEPGWAIDLQGNLYHDDPTGRVYSWGPGAYQVTAHWRGDDMPADIKHVVLAIAVAIWQGRDSGNFDTVGVPGEGAQDVPGVLTDGQRAILDMERARMNPA